MISKDRLSEINGLKLSDKISNMDDVSFHEYYKALNMFIDTYPNQESGLKDTFDKKDDLAFLKILEAVCDVLMLIYADDLVQSCIKLGREMPVLNRKQFEAHLTYLLTAISGLSISIQMALSEENAGATLDKQPAPNVKPCLTNKGKSILAVDDVSLVLYTLENILSDTGYTFVGLTSGKDALRYTIVHKPDLFILDIDMPDMDGYELANKIRDQGHIAPIIFLTGNATKAHVFKAIQAGAADFVVKPVSPDQVLEKIEKFMRF